MTSWLSRVRDTVRTQLWPVPTLAVVTALLLGFALPELDQAIDPDLSDRVSAWLFGGDSDAARSLLGAIASSLMTVTALTFSLTVVTLQLASSQFSPRLLRTFTSDLFVQVTLALFLATFTYALTVLRAVRNGTEGGSAEFVPRLAVTVAFVLAVASVLGLVLFLAHLTERIRVETMLRDVHSEASSTVAAVLSERDPRGRRAEPQAPEGSVPLSAAHDGFLTWIDRGSLVEAAVAEDAVLRIDAHPGRYLVRDTPLGAVWAATGSRLEPEAAQRLARRVAECVHVGFERTSAQDVGFGLRQLTDVANKALSPGVNDPTTAIHALGHISSFLCQLADRDLGADLARDEDDTVRLVLRRPDLAAYIDLGISQPRRYGAADPQVLQRLYLLLLELAHRVAPEHRPVVRDQLERLRATADAQPFDAPERAALAELGRQVEATLREEPPT